VSSSGRGWLRRETKIRTHLERRWIWQHLTSSITTELKRLTAPILNSSLRQKEPSTTWCCDWIPVVHSTKILIEEFHHSNCRNSLKMISLWSCPSSLTISYREEWLCPQSCKSMIHRLSRNSSRWCKGLICPEGQWMAPRNHHYPQNNHLKLRNLNWTRWVFTLTGARAWVVLPWLLLPR
jgi:hypothetical protein